MIRKRAWIKKESRKAYPCILNFSYISKVNRSQSMVHSSVKLRTCIKNFAWSVKTYTISNYTNIFCKCPSGALSFSPSDCGFVKTRTFWRSSLPSVLSELVSAWTNPSYFNFFFFLLSHRAIWLLCGESQTIVAMWFCGPPLPFKICPMWGICIAPRVAVWASLCDCPAL